MRAASATPPPPPFPPLNNHGSPLVQCALSGAAVSVANTATIPLDVLKVRMQMASASAAAAAAARVGGGGAPSGLPKLPGLAATAAALARAEGPAAFFSGLGPALARGLFYGGARLGMYGPLKAALGGGGPGGGGGEPSPSPSPSSVGVGVAAGAASGVGAALLTSPIDLAKTRLQAPRPAGVPRPSVGAVVRGVLASSGLRGLWAGAGPAAARAAVQTASQCATYDAAKSRIASATGWGEASPATHLAAAGVTGAVVTTATAPVDLVKTRLMCAPQGQFAGALACGASIVRHEGPAALMRGWSVQYARLGPQSVVTFVVLERLRELAGLSGF